MCIKFQVSLNYPLRHVKYISMTSPLLLSREDAKMHESVSVYMSDKYRPIYNTIQRGASCTISDADHM